VGEVVQDAIAAREHVVAEAWDARAETARIDFILIVVWVNWAERSRRECVREVVGEAGSCMAG
jgi:hypothetical protein